MIRSVVNFESGFDHPKSTPLRSKNYNLSPSDQPSISNPINKKRPASPISISEAACLAGPQGSRKRRHPMFERTSSNLAEATIQVPEWSSSQSQHLHDLNPATPEIDADNPISDRSVRRRRLRSSSDHETQNSRVETPKGSQANLATPQILSPSSEVPRTDSFEDEFMETFNGQLENSGNRDTWRARVHRGPTNARIPGDQNTGLVLSENAESRLRPRPSALDTAAAQDISLPSPSLSPITAASNLQNRRGYFEDQSNASTNTSGKYDVLHRSTKSHAALSATQESLEDSQGSLGSNTISQIPDDVESTNDQSSTPSLMNIPSILNTFEAMPTEMKTYVMYQMLRRCPKPVLHFVANTVSPALKCDFLSLLPLELSLNIIGHLDVKTLCRAAQVSKKWRQTVNSDENAWKHLFDKDGYVMPDGELQRAIREGWGWQYASRPDDWEKDLGASGLATSDTEWSVASNHTGLAGIGTIAGPTSGSTTSQSKRLKRKTVPKGKPKVRKQPKRGEASTESAPKSGADSDSWPDRAIPIPIEGPHAAASAAALAVPYPRIGLPRLRNLHLFKSIYQRHHIIRKSWMQDETKPRHIAFRAHQRHVVTCLQFDTDKILTGSDDTNINVYDTQTGALRARLEGHEGGVWALQYEGNVLVSGSTDRSVRVWDIKKGICTQVFQGHTSTVRCLQILMPTPVRMADGKMSLMPKEPLIITGSRDSNLRVWKLPKPGDKPFFQAGPAPDDTDCPYFVRVLNGHQHSVRAIAAHGDTLVSGSYDFTVRVWKISTGETVHHLQGHTQKVYSVVLDHKRNRCISGSMDNLVKVWSLETGTVLFNLEGHSSLVGLLDLQQDRLVSAAADSTLRIWDPENGHCRSILSAHTGAITCFQHDGQKVISGSDRTLKMWNVTNGDFVKDLLTDLSGVWQVKFNERRCVAAVQRNNLTYIEVPQYPHLESYYC